MKSLIVIRQQSIVPEIAFQPVRSFFQHTASFLQANKACSNMIDQYFPDCRFNQEHLQYQNVVPCQQIL